jgi:hypothetical protein
VFRRFWLLVSDENAFAETLHALYYLPENYHMIIGKRLPSRLMDGMTETPIAKRVHFETVKGLPKKASPFSFAYISIHSAGSSRQRSDDVPAIIITPSANSDIQTNEWNGFTVRGKPEAIASAVLNITRALA